MNNISPLLLLFLHLIANAQTQNEVFTVEVLNELEYFGEFTAKFQSHYTEYPVAYVILISKDAYADEQGVERYYFLVSNFYHVDILAYVNPKSHLYFNNSHYLIREGGGSFDWYSELVNEYSQSIHEDVYSHLYPNQETWETGPSLPLFSYCYWFQTIDGKLTPGMSMEPCDGHKQMASKGRFFYDNSDIERVEGKTIEEIMELYNVQPVDE